MVVSGVWSEELAAKTNGFGIAEWYGRSYALLSDQQRRELLRQQKEKQRPSCFHRNQEGEPVKCKKARGVCSFRKYVRDAETGEVTIDSGPDGQLHTVCPNRFYEDGVVYRWIGEELLGDAVARVVEQVPFLSSTLAGEEGDVDASKGEKAVGRIDAVLVAQDGNWCAVEMQAVYFSNSSLEAEWAAIEAFDGCGIPFPGKPTARPDFRSSAPKRLMPQLQTKVPTLRRWGRKMAVVVDERFFASLDRKVMREVGHISNADIIWFVVGYERSPQKEVLVRRSVYPTTLERAVEGLTAGQALSLPEFEQALTKKILDQDKKLQREARKKARTTLDRGQ